MPGKWQKERTQRLSWYREHLSRDNVGKIRRDSFFEAHQETMGGEHLANKAYKAEKVIEENGLEKMRSALQELLYGASPIQNRWDQVSHQGFRTSRRQIDENVQSFHHAL